MKAIIIDLYEEALTNMTVQKQCHCDRYTACRNLKSMLEVKQNQMLLCLQIDCKNTGFVIPGDKTRLYEDNVGYDYVSFHDPENHGSGSDFCF